MMYPKVNTQLKNRVMRRVYGIWFFKKVVPWICFEFAALSVFIFFMNTNVHFLRVYGSAKTHTLANDPLSFIRFMYDAYMYTEVTVQLGIIGLLILFVLVVKDILQGAKLFSFPRDRNFSRT